MFALSPPVVEKKTAVKFVGGGYHACYTYGTILYGAIGKSLGGQAALLVLTPCYYA